MSVKAVVFNTENVWWNGFSGEICLDPNTHVNEVIDTLKENQYLTERDVKTLRSRLKRYGNVAINSFGLLGDLIGGPWPGSGQSLSETQDYKNRIERRVAGISQSFITGLKMGMIKHIADNVDLTENTESLVEELREAGIYQVASSNGVAPFVYAVDRRVGGTDYVEAPETVVRVGGDKRIFTPDVLDNDEAEVRPKFKGNYDRLSNVSLLLKEKGIEPRDVLYIESNDPNIDSIMEMKSEGSHVVAFYPSNEMDKLLYEKSGIPRIDKVGKPDAGYIMEIAMDPKKIGVYCV